jgi:hypothetical protein
LFIFSWVWYFEDLFFSPVDGPPKVGVEHLSDLSEGHLYERWCNSLDFYYYKHCKYANATFHQLNTILLNISDIFHYIVWNAMVTRRRQRTILSIIEGYLVVKSINERLHIVFAPNSNTSSYILNMTSYEEWVTIIPLVYRRHMPANAKIYSDIR